VVSDVVRINEHQETRYLFNKLHVENECVLEILQSSKVNIFGQKVGSWSAISLF
jgi:hypothetical protein